MTDFVIYTSRQKRPDSLKGRRTYKTIENARKSAIAVLSKERTNAKDEGRRIRFYEVYIAQYNLEKGRFVTLGHVDKGMIVKTKKRMYFWNPSKIREGREIPIDKATGKTIKPKGFITVKKDSPSARAWAKAGELMADAMMIIPWSL